MKRRLAVPALAATGAGATCAVLLRQRLVRCFGTPARRRGTSLPTEDGVAPVAVPGPGGAVLRCLVLRADRPSGTAVVVHGWGGSAVDLLPVGRLLQDEGLDVLLLDARGHGRSDDVRLTSMPHIADDVAAAVRWWRTADLSRERLLLVGHSVGAGACLLVARDAPEVVGVVLLASMAHPREVMARLLTGAGLPPLSVAPALRVAQALIGRRFEDFAPVRVLAGLERPVLLVHGADDTTIPVADARRLAAVARDAELVVVPGSGHSDLAAVPEVVAGLRRLLARSPAARHGLRTV